MHYYENTPVPTLSLSQKKQRSSQINSVYRNNRIKGDNITPVIALGHKQLGMQTENTL